MAIEHGPSEDGFPIENGDLPASYVIVYQRVISVGMQLSIKVVDGSQKSGGLTRQLRLWYQMSVKNGIFLHVYIPKKLPWRAPK